MKAIDYKMEDHYSTIMSWWKKRKFTPVFPQHLPKGFIIQSDEGEYVCAGWLYKCEDSKLRFLEWVIGNPGCDKNLRDKSLNLLFESLLSLTEKNDLVLGFSEHPALIRRYMKHGFIKGDENMTLLWNFRK